MQSSQAPGKIQLPFAASGTKNAIPVPSQQGITPGAASYTDGFPPLTFTPKAAGGIPPSGADINGVLNAITALQQWKSAGGQFPFDATFAAAIGGYPKGAVLINAQLNGYWINTVENNTSNPDSGGAGWVNLASGTSDQGAQTFTSSGTFSVPPVLYSGHKFAMVTVIGAGGGSGSIYSVGAAGGGGGGGFARGYVNLTGVGSVAVTVGIGGSGSAAATSSNLTLSGSPGGTSSFGTIFSATGGGAGLNWLGGSSGVGVGATLNTGLGNGANGSRNDGQTNPLYVPGAGGGPGAAPSGGNGSNAVAATIAGGGASGGWPGTPGASGANGLVIVEY